MPSFAAHVQSCKVLFAKWKLFRRAKLGYELALLGSVIVDLDEFGLLKKVHGRSRAFLDYLAEHDPKMVPLAVGMILHEELDKVIDEEYVHPNEAHAKELIAAHPELCNIEMGGHYLLDYALDCALIEKDPALLEDIERVRSRFKPRHARRIAKHLATFFDGDQARIYKILLFFRDFDIARLAHEEKRCELWMHYLFLQHANAVAVEKRGFLHSLRSKVWLGFKYGKMLGSDHRQKALSLVRQAKQRFVKNQAHASLMTRATSRLDKPMRTLLASHAGKIR